MENLTNSFKKNSNDTDLYEYGLFVRLFMLWTKQKIQPNYIEEILKHSFNTIAPVRSQECGWFNSIVSFLVQCCQRFSNWDNCHSKMGAI